MKALVLEGIEKVVVRDVPVPQPGALGALVRVMANGVCRSDWHMWNGDIPRDYPTIMGHEMVGVVEEVTAGVGRFKRGDRVIVPFSSGDGTCDYCRRGLSNLCDRLMVPSRAYSGGYAEYVAVPLADQVLVPLPDVIGFAEGAALGCRFMTAFHGVASRARAAAGEWVVVYGCGGIGLSAVNTAAALGSQVIGVDVNPANLALARALGASHVIDSRTTDPVAAVIEITQGGAHVSVDALGIAQTCVNGVRSLRKAGRHLQLGITTKAEKGYIALPIDEMVKKEITFLGSHGMPSHEYASMVPLVASRRIQPARMITREIALSEVESIFHDMTTFSAVGTFVVTRFQ